ncbi:cellulase family glycosylhydrolase [Mycobacterium sp. M1]|uniref:Cellulase family glycosylhydrolase n=1 Tax=Mycolicibacter acidiphilus TaxID=2835306 RepID=A0ABS5RJZ9_9MYCO|nr:cellulase family glycosylhydrolase [Mycolicibacter acidiphilus]MBS9534603.1 cellulase family glycosylhydrolase [Mycolicibacter acidiphilus]
MTGQRRTTVAGTAAVLALGISGLLPAAPAQAETFDDVLDQVFAALLTPDHWDTALSGSAGFDGGDIYTLLHDAEQQWITSDLGKQVDSIINLLAPAGQQIIGNGTAGTEAHPDGGVGGWLFGDGGAGWDSTTAGVAGGAGGAAGLFGNGGNGGDGGAGAAGGDGGAGGSVFGVGGNGGDAGDGGDGLPALGGAGGLAGAFGVHGAVGHAGTLPGGTGETTSPVEVTNNWLTDADGKVVMLHGLNQVYKIPPYEPSADGFSDDDAAFLEANGFNAVRLGVIWAGVEPQPGVIDTEYLASIAQTVQVLAKHHIVAILDMHQDLYNEMFQGEGAPDWAVQDGGLPNPALGFPGNYLLNPAENHAWDAFWGNAKASDGVGLENHYAQMWEAVAHYFKDNPNVAGYEIMNEPWAGSQTLPSIFGSAHFGEQQLTPFYNQVDAAIRAVDPSKPVFFEPSPLVGSLPLQTHLGSVDDPNSVYSFHNYCIVTSLIPTSDFGCGLNADIVTGNAADYAQAHNIPAMMTEFGATDTIGTITAGMQAANQHMMGWTEWAYTGHDITSSSPNGQALVLDPSKPPVGDNVNDAKLDALAEPYPQTVAGTPTGWSFENGVFTFSYSTAHADGSGDFGAGSQTTISVPSVEYPNGYQVSVTGGHVVSAPNAGQLLIASDPGATSVSVTVNAAH